MNILIINFEYPPLGGGGGVATQQLGKELAKHHIVHILTTAYGGMPREEVAGTVHIHRVLAAGRRHLATASLVSMAMFVPSAFLRGWQLCRSTSFDVINAQFVLPSGLPAAALAWLYKIPFVLSFIGGDLYDPTKGVSPHRHWWLRALIRLVVRQATVCTAISEDTRRRAQQLHGVTKDIQVTPLGYSPRSVVSASRRQLDLPTDTPIAISIGRLIPRKGYQTILEAWRHIPLAHLLIVGTGPLQAKLRRQAQILGIDERVHLVGFVSEERKLQLLRTADIYVSATHHEGFGIVFLEAMEAGLPIVAPNQGGQVDFLEDNVNALLVSPDSASQISEAVRGLLDDPGLRQRMAVRNQQAVKEFTTEQSAQRFEAVLDQTVARHRS
jgi:L-malate glycosyltransferase